jgi:multidrug resistance efflux pump
MFSRDGCATSRALMNRLQEATSHISQSGSVVSLCPQITGLVFNINTVNHLQQK